MYLGIALFEGLHKKPNTEIDRSARTMDVRKFLQVPVPAKLASYHLLIPQVNINVELPSGLDVSKTATRTLLTRARVKMMGLAGARGLLGLASVTQMGYAVMGCVLSGPNNVAYIL